MDSYSFLDDHPHTGDGNMTLIGLNEEFADVNLFYLSKYELYELSISFEQYLWCLTQTMGYIDWQFLFCNDLNSEMRNYMQNIYEPKFKKDFQTLWPQIDLEQFFALVRSHHP